MYTNSSPFYIMYRLHGIGLSNKAIRWIGSQLLAGQSMVKTTKYGHHQGFRLGWTWHSHGLHTCIRAIARRRRNWVPLLRIQRNMYGIWILTVIHLQKTWVLERRISGGACLEALAVTVLTTGGFDIVLGRPHKLIQEYGQMRLK